MFNEAEAEYYQAIEEKVKEQEEVKEKQETAKEKMKEEE